MTPNPNMPKSVVFTTDSCSEGVQDRTGNKNSERRTENQRSSIKGRRESGVGGEDSVHEIRT
jgi:hypothetical protein